MSSAHTHSPPPVQPVTLDALIQDLPGATLASGGQTQISGITHDSRRVQPGDLFVALSGAHANGARFVTQAVMAGARAVAVGEGVEMPPVEVPVIRLAAPRPDLARLSAGVFGRPADQLHLVGVTGTNGKTTVTRLIAAMCEAAGLTPGLVGTIGHGVGHQAAAGAAHTTPEAPDLHRIFHEMVNVGVQVCAMEVSSVGLAERRVDGLAFQVAAFLNLSPDHLDYHGTMEAYGAAKARLFTELVAPTGVAIVSVDDPFGARLAARAECSHTTWRLGQRPGSDVRFETLTLHADGLSGQLATPVGPVLVESPLMGRFNATNVATAAASALALGLPVQAIEDGLATATIPGRMEAVPNEEGLTVLVDYAHSPDALARAIEAVRPLTAGRIWCVFGCGGDRDAAKRPLMGRSAARADGVIITSDNPRSEDPRVIADAAAVGAVAAGCALTDRPSVGHTWVELDREAAIHGVIAAAEPGDVVLIAGKGHERYQEIAGERRPFDDVEVSTRALDARGGVRCPA